MAVGEYSILPFAGPVSSPVGAETVRGNDETLRAKFVAHQNDAVAHVRAGLVADRPASADEGTVWIGTDGGVVTVFVYTGGGWI